MIVFIIASAILWAVCGYYAYGFYFAYFQGQLPMVAKERYNDHKEDAFTFSLFGPIALLVVLSSKGYVHGRKYK